MPRKKTTKKQTAKKKKGPPYTDEDVFEMLGVGTGDQALRRLIHGQRMINGRLYRAIETILDHLSLPKDKMVSAAETKRRAAALARADKQNEEIPGKVPPFCDDRGLGGGPGGT